MMKIVSLELASTQKNLTTCKARVIMMDMNDLTNDLTCDIVFGMKDLTSNKLDGIFNDMVSKGLDKIRLDKKQADRYNKACKVCFLKSLRAKDLSKQKKL